MIGDVSKAEKKFRNLVGKSKADELLKRLDAAEAQNLKGENMITYLKSKISSVSFELNDRNLGELFGERGIVYLLSTRPHTSSNSNFVKLVKNKVTSLSGYVMEYLEKPERKYKLSDSLKNFKDSLTRYLKLKDTEESDEELEKIKKEGEFEVTNKLKRKKNKDVAEKMQSHRKVNRLKVMVVALIIYLVDQADQKAASNSKHENESSEEEGKRKAAAEEQERKDEEKQRGEEEIKDKDKRREEEANRDRVSEIITKLEAGTATKEEYDEFLDYCDRENDEILKKVKKIIVPQGVTEMNLNDKCSDLQEVIIPSSVKIIKEGCFESFKKLSIVNIAEGIKKIDSYAFAYCESLANIKLPETLEFIGENAFAGCENLNNITIPNNVSELGWKVFDGCKSLETVVIGNGITKIPLGAFAGCKKLNNITIPNNVSELGQAVFDGCESLETVVISNEITKIPSEAFYGCVALPKVELGNNVKEIGVNAFYRCSSLQEITVPNSVSKIGLWAFRGCPKGMEIKGDASEEIKDEIRKQIGA